MLKKLISKLKSSVIKHPVAGQQTYGALRTEVTDVVLVTY